MSDVILSIAIFHSLSALALISAVLLSAFNGNRSLRAARRLPVIARPILVSARQKPVAVHDALPAAA